jgi:hypothetical protein
LLEEQSTLLEELSVLAWLCRSVLQVVTLQQGRHSLKGKSPAESSCKAT